MESASFLIAIVALAVSVVAALLTSWQVMRGEQALEHRAWAVFRLDHGPVAPGRRGYEIELSVVGRAVLHEVTPFVHGGMTLHRMSEPRPRLDCTSVPVTFVADTVESADADTDSWVGVTWLSPRRWGRIHVEEAIRIHIPTGRVQHWLWNRGPIPLTWRKKISGRWGSRPVRLGRARYDVPGLDESMLRERARLERRRALSVWPPRAHQHE